MIKLLPILVLAFAPLGTSASQAATKPKPVCSELRAVHAKAKHDGRYAETRRAARRIRAANCH